MIRPPIALAVMLLILFANGGRSDEPLNPGPVSSEMDELIPDAMVDGATIVDCYDAAVANLENVCEDYRRIKALELSKIRDIAFLDAFENIQSVMPILKPIDRELLRRPITDPSDIVTHKREVEKVEAEVENMIDLVTRLLLEIEVVQQQMLAEESSGAEVKPVTLQDIVESPEYDPDSVDEESNDPTKPTDPVEQKLTEKAKEKEDEPAVDLTTEMRVLSQSPKPKESDKPKEMTESQQPVPSAVAPPTGEEKKKGKGKPPVIVSPVTPSQMAGTSFKQTETNFEVGRRVVSEGGAPVEWMFVDTWYTIGPFPNPKRINLNRKFPPETIVNLSATYRGKDDRIVGWEFLQTNKIRCIPLHDEEFAIYYAYTELWFDQPMELWVAIGSDDKANVWVNGLPIWISGDQLKTWRINEGLRKVHFKQGVNRVLYRVENGWKGTSFSMGIEVKK